MRKDHAGKRFGRLVAIRFDRFESGRTYWLLKCDCGNETIAMTQHFLKGTTSSCGCLHSEISRKMTINNLPNFKHGDAARGKAGSSIRIYMILSGMKQRCGNPNHPAYYRYGGRGIKVCLEWHDYLTFKAWAIVSGYRPGLTIDRKNNDSDYCPENCQWLTRAENTSKGNK